MQIDKKKIRYILWIIVMLLLLFHLFYPAESKSGQNKNPIKDLQDLPAGEAGDNPGEGGSLGNNTQKDILGDNPVSLRNNRALPKSQHLKNGSDERNFITKLKRDIPGVSVAKLAEMRKRILLSDKINPANFAIEFISSNNEKVKNFGLEIAEGICLKRPDAFRPNEFFKAFAKEGFKASQYLSKIIAGTDDDFIREWACELWSEIYYHNSSSGDSRHLKLAECKKSEENIYNFLREVLSDKDKLEEITKSRGPLGDIIIKEWGDEKRMPLKMIALVSVFDLSSQNREVCSEQARKIISKYNFNYNILGRMNNIPIERPYLPQEALLKKLSNEVFRDKYKDTYKWVKKEDGGFSVKEMRIAVEMKDRRKMEQMIAVFRKIITDVLKGKLLVGDGQNEIEILRFFYSKTWGNQPFAWGNRMLILKNHHKNSVLLVITSDKKDESPVTFLIPNRSKFIWFLPEGKYKITTDQASEIGFLPKIIDIKYQNITVEI
jgi:hypothetical protein